MELVSQSPLAAEHPHDMSAEKLLVDIIAEKSIGATFSPSEIPSIYENVLGSYRVGKRKMFRYAGRRGKKEELEVTLNSLPQKGKI